MKPLVTVMFILLLTGLSFCAVEIRLGNASGGAYTEVAGSTVWSKAQISTINNVNYTFTINILGSFVVERDNVAVDIDGNTLQPTFECDIGIKEHLSSMNNTVTTNVDLTEVNVNICPYSSSGNTLRNEGSTRHQRCICMNSSSSNTVGSRTLTEDTSCNILSGFPSQTTTYCSVNSLKHTVSHNFETNLGDDCYLLFVNTWSIRGLVTIVTRQGWASNSSPPNTTTASLNFSTNIKIFSMFGVTAGGIMPHCW